MATLAENRYGKSLVRLVRVRRQASAHKFQEWTVQILLQGDFESCFVQGDNSKILPTDTMKNTVYSLARSCAAECIEDFAKELASFLLQRNAQVSRAKISMKEKAWDHIIANGKPHPTAFMQSSAELRTTTVSQAQNAAPLIVSGLENLLIMKTANSAFAGYIKDELTSLPESEDRLLGTAVRANWRYTGTNLDFAALRTKIRDTLLAAFASHDSKSVQHTLYAMAERVLETVPELEDIELVMPNKHCLLVDLSRFGQDNPNEIFVPIDEPHGYIEARVVRKA
jgi:urate oxidase